MNLFFLMEDSKSFVKVLPKWINFIIPNYTRVDDIKYFQKNQRCYVIESGYGYPQIIDYLSASLLRISTDNCPVDYIFVCWDTDGKNDEVILKEKFEYEKIFQDINPKYNYKLFAMNHCFETWLLGNRAAFPKRNHITEQFNAFAEFYNVSKDDPECMNAPSNYNSSSKYHTRYLKEMLRNTYHRNYSKSKPMFVSTEAYFNELISRIEETDDLRSFYEFIQFLRSINLNFSFFYIGESLYE